MSDTVVISIVTADRLAAGSTQHDTFKIDRAEWDAMTPAQRSQRCVDAADEAASNRFEWGWHIDDPADLASTEG